MSARSTTSAHGGADPLTSAAASSTGVVAWYAQGFSDQLGDRLLLFDNTDAPPLELLRLAQRLTDDPSFEPALRKRVEELRPFEHPAFARVRGVNVLAEPTPQLALVSDHIPGQRLSEILRAARAAGFKPDPGTALWLVRQLMPAVAALHELGAEIAHGTLSPDRIIVTPTGDLVITEYVFAHAIDQLDAGPTELWRELGVAVSPESGRIDRRGDIEQVALLALNVLLGRPLGPNEYPGRVNELLNEACDPQRWSLVPPLRTWLNRALRLRGSFSSAAEALDTLDELLPRVTGMWAARLLPQNVRATAPTVSGSRGAAPAELNPAQLPPPNGNQPAPRQSGARGTYRILDFEHTDRDAKRAAMRHPRRAITAESLRRLRWLCLALASIAVAEAIALMVALGGEPRPVASSPPALDSPARVELGSVTDINRPPSSSDAVVGWLSVAAPVEVEVHLDGRFLAIGTDLRLRIPPGRHDVALSNEQYGFRSVQRVTVATGQRVALRPGLVGLADRL